MSDRGISLLFSVGVILATLGIATWLILTGQAAYIDGLFLLLSCFVLAAAFCLYVRYLIRSTMQVAPSTGPAKIIRATQEKTRSPILGPARQSPETVGERTK